MFCEGFVLDTVEFVSPISGAVIDHTAVSQDWRVWLEATSWEILANDETKLARTLVADSHHFTLDVGMRSSCMAGCAERAHGAHPYTFRRKLFVTTKGYLGIGEDHSRPGDIVAILMGGQLPFILRKSGGYHALIGEAYVDGFVDGEAMERPEAREMTVFEIS
jgi:hypothetical protein